MNILEDTLTLLQNGGAMFIVGLALLIVYKIVSSRFFNGNGNGKNGNGNGNGLKCALDPQVLSAFAEAAKATSERSEKILHDVSNAVTAIAVFTEKVDSLNTQMMRCFDRQEENGRELREIYEHLSTETGNTLSAVERELAYVQETQSEINGKLDMAIAVKNAQPLIVTHTRNVKKQTK